MDLGEAQVRIIAQDEASKVIDDIMDKLDGLGKKSQNNSNKFASAWKSTGDALNDITKPLQIASVAMAGAGAASAKLAIDFEDNFASVKKTVDGTPEQLDAIRQSLIDMSTKGINGHNAIPQTTAELSELAAAGGQLGIATENIASFTETMAMLGSATNLQGEEGAATLARIANVSGVAQDQFENMGSALVDLGNNFATTEKEIADMAMNMAATGNTVGIGIQDVLAYSTTLSSLGVEAAAGGSSMSRIWMGLQQAVSGGGKALEGFAKVSGKSSKEFAEQWKTDANGAFVDFLKGLNQSEDQVQALSDLGINNIRDQQALLKLAGDSGLGLLTDALKTSSNAWSENTALMNEFNAKAETTASKIAVAKNNIVEAGRSMGEALLPTVASAAQGLASVAQGFANMSDGSKKAILTMGAVTIGAGALAKGTASTLVTIGKMKTGWATLTAGSGKLATSLKGIGTAASGVAAPIAAAAGAVLAYGLVMNKVADEYNAKRAYKWADNFGDLANETDRATESFKEYSSLQKELSTIRDEYNQGKYDTPEKLELAKARVQEIANALKEKYNLDIDVPLDDLDEALNKLDQIAEKEGRNTYNDMKSKSSELNATLASDNESYKQSKQDFVWWENEYSKQQSNMNALSDAYAQAKTARYNYEANVKNDPKNREKYNQELKNSIDLIKEEAKARGADSYQVDQVTNDWADDNFESIKKGYENFLSEYKSRKEAIDKFETARGEYVDYGLAELQYGDAEQGLNALASAVKNYGASATDTAQKAADLQTGIQGLQGAMQSGHIEQYLQQYSDDMLKFGQTAPQVTQGIRDMVSNLDFSDLDESQIQGVADAINSTIDQLNPDNGITIDVNAEGDISILDEASEKVMAVDSHNGIDVSVNADGDLSILDEATGEMEILQGLGAVSLQVNADGNIEILDEAEQKIAEVNGETGEITVNGEYPGAEQIEKALQDQNQIQDKDVKQTVTGSFPGEDKIATAISYQGQLADKSVTYTVNVVVNDPNGQIGKVGGNNATGTSYWRGGWSFVNDQVGVSDPRELIIDNGRAFIPEGRNVLLPLSRGAKVYTASQTKRIMRELGIPGFANGRDNDLDDYLARKNGSSSNGGSGDGYKKPEISDALKKFKDQWSHEMKTRAVSITEELNKWNEAMEQFGKNSADADEIQENIYATTVKLRKEQNELSEDYLSTMSALGEWAENGDDPLEAYGRMYSREMAYVEDGTILYTDAVKEMSKVGKSMYSNRISASKDWIDHELNYNNMSQEDYRAGIDRMRQYTKEYYDKGLIDKATYLAKTKELDEDYIDSYAKDYSRWTEDADLYMQQRNTYEDWDEWGDSAVKAYGRVMAQEQEWIAFYKANGSIDDVRKHEQAYAKAEMEQFKALGDEYDKNILEPQKKVIDQTTEYYDNLISKRREAAQVNDLRESIQDAEADMKKYASAVTEAGKAKYKAASKQAKDSKYELETLNLEKERTRVINRLNNQYDKLEREKMTYIKSMKALDGVDFKSYVSDVTKNLTNGSGQNIPTLLNKVINILANAKLGGTTYGDTIIHTSEVANMPQFDGVRVAFTMG